MPSARSGALRVEPLAASQAKPPATIAKRKCRLTERQQIERFGVTFDEAHEIRDRAERVVGDMAAARAAWQALSYELRGNKGQPHICPAHPEAVRFKLLAALADGYGIAAAVDMARAFAWQGAA